MEKVMTKWIYVFYSTFIVFSLVSVFLFDRSVLAVELFFSVLFTLFLLRKVWKNEHTDNMSEAENTGMCQKDMPCKGYCVPFVTMTKDMLPLKEQKKRFAQRLDIMDAKSKILSQSSIYQRFSDYVSNPLKQPLTDDDWAELLSFLESIVLSFQDIKNDIADISPDSYRICALVRYGFKPTEIAIITGKTNSYITKVRQSLLLRIFHITRSASVFDTLIMFLL